MSQPNETERAWPKDGLERVDRCPICDSDQRELQYENLRDRVFLCAPGRWSLYRCATCESGYLDPRPNEATIGLAYQEYYTHADADYGLGSPPAGMAKHIRRALTNGYRNHRYGTDYSPSTRLGRWVLRFLPAHRRRIDLSMRHLPHPRRGDRLLDFGCGSGAFLLEAKAAGWDGVGVDLDPQAVATARARGLNVHQGGIKTMDSRTQQFAAITLSHVIEHVHDPNTLIKACHALLQPGGSLWLDTPNMESLGHRRYAQNWRGLEPPRHLVLFTHASLESCLTAAGFEWTEDMPYVPMSTDRFRASKAIAEGENPYHYGLDQLTTEDLRAAKEAERLAAGDPALRESITIVARKAR